MSSSKEFNLNVFRTFYDAKKDGPAQKAELSWGLQKVHGAVRYLKHGNNVLVADCKTAPKRTKGANKLVDLLGSDDE